MDAPALTGFPLDVFDDALAKVAPEFDADPVASFDPWSLTPEWAKRYVLDMGHEPDVPFMRIHTQLGMDAYADFPFDEMCRLHHSGSTYMANAIRERRENDPRWAILHKLKSSAWHWTRSHSGRLGWNDMVDLHSAIRSFDICVPGFETTLDWTRGTNERGGGVASKTWLDGVFAYLVHHKGRHVMTVGFSVTADRRVLIQQIQNAERRGNRWLFAFPRNRVEHVVERFTAAFEGFTVMLADGGDVAGYSLGLYRSELREQSAKRREYAVRLKKGQGDPEHQRSMRRYHSDQAKAAAVKVKHLADELPRLAAFYADAGRYRRGEAVESNGLVHYAMAA